MGSKVLVLWVVIILLFAGVHISNAGNLEMCFKKASRFYNVSEKILRAIAKTESDYHPYAVNVRGKAHYFKNLYSAIKYVDNHKRQYPDIGLMQVNISWFHRLKINWKYGFNPCYSIFIGAYVLRKKINKYGENWKGIAAYHSASPYKNVMYAWSLYKNLPRR